MLKQGEKLVARYSRLLMMPRPDGTVWGLTIQPLRLGFSVWLREKGILPPSPPISVARDAKGRVQRDSEGLPITKRDENDADYQLGLEKYYQRMAVLMIWDGLQADPEIVFETEIPGAGESWVDYADALFTELEGAGFSPGDLAWLCEEISGMSYLTNRHLVEAEQNFFSESRGERTAPAI